MVRGTRRIGGVCCGWRVGSRDIVGTSANRWGYTVLVRPSLGHGPFVVYAGSLAGLGAFFLAQINPLLALSAFAVAFLRQSEKEIV